MGMEKAGLSVDVIKCIGCRGCQVACKQWNELPAEETSFSGSYENPVKVSGHTWTRVLFVEEKQENGNVRFLFRKIQCMHCTEASCIEVCPVGAISHNKGTVLINEDRCIGCKNCIVACPFSAVGLDPVRGVARKCWFCQNRIENGLNPACVKSCPSGALQFGKKDEILANAKARVKGYQVTGRKAYLYGENELGGLNALYVLDAPPSVYGLPENPKLATSAVLGNWLGVLVGAGILAFGFFKLFFSEKDTDSGKTTL